MILIIHHRNVHDIQSEHYVIHHELTLFVRTRDCIIYTGCIESVGILCYTKMGVVKIFNQTRLIEYNK